MSIKLSSAVIEPILWISETIFIHVDCANTSIVNTLIHPLQHGMGYNIGRTRPPWADLPDNSEHFGLQIG